MFCGTSRAYIYLGCNTENKRGYISCGSVQVEGTSTWLFKENKGGYIPCGSLLVKDFTRLKEISRTGGCLGLDVGTGCCRTSIKTCVCFLFPYTI